MQFNTKNSFSHFVACFAEQSYHFKKIRNLFAFSIQPIIWVAWGVNFVTMAYQRTLCIELFHCLPCKIENQHLVASHQCLQSATNLLVSHRGSCHSNQAKKSPESAQPTGNSSWRSRVRFPGIRSVSRCVKCKQLYSIRFLFLSITFSRLSKLKFFWKKRNQNLE